MTREQELLIDGCKLMGLSCDETLIVYQILLSPEQVSDMLDWMIENIRKDLKPIDVILADGEIQMKHKGKEFYNLE